MTDHKRIPVYLPKHQHKTLKDTAHEDGTSIADHVRKAVDNYLPELEGQLFAISRWSLTDIKAQLEQNGFTPTEANVQRFLDYTKGGETFRNLLAQAGNEIMRDLMDDIENDLKPDAPNQNPEEESK